MKAAFGTRIQILTIPSRLDCNFNLEVFELFFSLIFFGKIIITLKLKGFGHLYFEAKSAIPQRILTAHHHRVADFTVEIYAETKKRALHYA